MSLHFGFDIGVASVGFSVVNDDYDILELGSSLFPCADASENETRRNMRGTRRLLRRRKTRIRDFQKLFKIATNIDVSTFTPIVNVLELKNKGLTEKLSINELYFVLLNYIKHKGISYLDDEIAAAAENEDDNDKKEKKLSPYQSSLKENIDALQNKLPCQIQLERFKTQGKYRSDINYTFNDNSLNIFSTKKYIEEIEKLLNTQSKYHDFIMKEFSFENYFASQKENTDTLMFMQHFIYLFSRKREYYVGPGNEKSRTDYGIYKTAKDENGNYKTIKNIFEELVGKCSIYDGKNGNESEFKTSMSSFAAESFNLLNDLNNIKVNNIPLSKEQRCKIIKEIIAKDSLSDKGVEKIILDVCEKKDGTISGNRINKKGEPLYSHYEAYRKLRNFLLKNLNINIDENTSFANNQNERINKIDKIMDILTLCTERDNIEKCLRNSESLNKKDSTILNLSDEMINALVEFRIKNKSLFTKWHNFSKKLINEIYPEMIETGEEQMTVLSKYKKEVQCSSVSNKLSKSAITEEIYNPVVKRSIRKCIDILNALIKKYGAPDEIVIEMPRDDNEAEQKDRIKKEQAKNEKEFEDIENKLKKDYGFVLKDEHFRNHKNLKLVLKLWNEQKEKCAYSLTPIKIEDLIYNYDNYEIDHIIPLSISLDDSRNNKVLVKKSENQKKAQRTAYDYINSDKTANELALFEQYVNETFVDEHKKKTKKAHNLLFNEDITKQEVVKGFISRNLNDTRYASRTFLDACQNFFKQNNLPTKVKVIRGSFTHAMRDGLKLKKDRDEDYSHHAIDSVLIAFSQMGYDNFKITRNKLLEKESIIDVETGEILDHDKYDKLLKTTDFQKLYDEELYKKKWVEISNNIRNAKKDVKYVWMVDKKPNRALTKKVTLYSTREYKGDLWQVDNLLLYDKDAKNDFAKFLDENANQVPLMRLYDEKTWEKLVSIFNSYIDAKNPFEAYKKETGNKITKYSKHNDGPEITKIKYLTKKVQTIGIDVSNKYKDKPKNKSVLITEANRYRADIFRNKETNKYKAILIQYKDLICKSNKYIVDENLYNAKKRENGINEDFEFCFSLYTNDIIKYKTKDRDYQIDRFLSSDGNVIEFKPISKSSYTPRKHPSINTILEMKKLNVDVLGIKLFDF